MEFAYGQPRYTKSGKRIVWQWTIRNSGTREVRKVVLTHRLAPKQARAASIGPPCLVVQGGAIECDYGTMRPGEERHGELTARFPRELQSQVQIRGSATWHAYGSPGNVHAASSPPGRGALPLDLGLLPNLRPLG